MNILDVIIEEMDADDIIAKKTTTEIFINTYRLKLQTQKKTEKL